MTYDQTLQQVAGDRQTVEPLEPVVKATLDKYIGLLRAKRDEFLALAEQYKQVNPSDTIHVEFGYHLAFKDILTTQESGSCEFVRAFRVPSALKSHGGSVNLLSFEHIGYHPTDELVKMKKTISKAMSNFPDNYVIGKKDCGFEVQANVWSSTAASFTANLKVDTKDRAFECAFSSTGNHPVQQLADANFLTGIIRWDLSPAGVYLPLAFLPLATIAAANRFLKDQVDNAHGRAATLAQTLDDLASF